MNVAIDLDGIIIFSEVAEIPIPGRSRASYLSSRTAALLAQLSSRCQLYVATARSVATLRALSELVPEVSFAGLVLECGHVQRADVLSQPTMSSQRSELEAYLKRRLPTWEFVAGYEQIICTLPKPSCVKAEDELRLLLQEESHFSGWTLQSERHKIFLYPRSTCKLAGLHSMGVDILHVAAGDDANYDSSMLSAAILPCTLKTADDAIVSMVRLRNGWVIEEGSHRGAEALLGRLIVYVGSQTDEKTRSMQ